MAEQTNFYAVLRAVPRSFKPVYGITNLYLYINIHRDSGWRSDTVFGCSLCKTHPCNGLCFAQFHAKIHNNKKSKQEKAHFEVNTLIFWQKADFMNFFHGVIIINVHVIIYHWKGQPFFCLKQFFFLFLFNLWTKLWLFLKPSYLII